MDGSSGKFWFNTRTGLVEETDEKSAGKDLLGPYATRADAEHALATARARTEQWDREEREWEGED